MLRRTEVWKDGQWIEVRFEDLKMGDVFRLFDPPDWTPVRWYFGASFGDEVEFIANSEPYEVPHDYEPRNVWSIDCTPKERGEE